MKLTKLSLLLSIAAMLVSCVSIFAQKNDTFSDPNVDYTFEMTDSTWVMTGKPSDMSPNVEYVYGSRTDGSFEVRKATVKSDQTLKDLIRDEETKLQFRPGYVAGKEEPFEGFLKGKVVNFEIVKSSRNWSGRYYYLQAGTETVYVLRFEAPRDKLRSIRNVTDQIARTFNVAKGK